MGRLILLLERGRIAGHVAYTSRPVTLCGEPFALALADSPPDGRVTCPGCRAAMMGTRAPRLPHEIECAPLPPLAACCAAHPVGAVMVPGGVWAAACSGDLMGWPPYLRTIVPGAMR